MILRGLLVTAIVLAVSGTAQAETKHQPDFTIGEWVGRTNRAPDGSVKFCSVAKVSRSGSALILGLSTADELEIGVFRVSWQLPVGEAYDVAISIDGQTVGSFRTDVTLVGKMIRIPMGKNAKTYERLRKGDRLHLAMAQEDLSFNLDGADAALDAVRDCLGTSD